MWARGERAWFLFYGLAAPVYRLGVLVGIAFYLAGEFLVLGVALAAWAVLMQVFRPLFRSLVFLATSQRLEARDDGGQLLGDVFRLGPIRLGSESP